MSTLMIREDDTDTITDDVVTISKNTLRMWLRQGAPSRRDAEYGEYEWNLATIEKTLVAVNKGAALLDKERPGWVGKIIPEDLQMDSSEFCIIGQVYGFYDDSVGIPFGMEAIDLGEMERRDRDRIAALAEEHGFLANGPSAPPYELLDRVWVYMLQVRHEEQRPLTLALPELN